MCVKKGNTNAVFMMNISCKEKNIFLPDCGEKRGRITSFLGQTPERMRKEEASGTFRRVGKAKLEGRNVTYLGVKIHFTLIVYLLLNKLVAPISTQDCMCGDS